MTDRLNSRNGLLFSKSARWSPAVAVFVLTLFYLLLRVPSPEFFLASDDHGYQLALGMAVATGRYPGFDFITQYGPFVAFSSWLAWAMSGSLIGEILLCAAGYATCVAFVYRVLARHANITIGALGVVLVLALFPRYYKWYYWLFPILTMVVAERFALLREATPGRLDRAGWATLAGWGILVGTAGLYRYDLLLEGVVFGAIVITAVEWTRTGPTDGRQATVVRLTGVYVASTLIVPVLFGALVWALRGPHQVALLLLSIIDGTIDTVDYYLLRPFRFGPGGPFAGENILAFLQLAIPVFYVSSILLSLRRLRAAKVERRREGIPLLCAGLMGLGIFPQALHRADLAHLLQVIPPLIIVFGLLLHLFLEGDFKGARKNVGIAAFLIGLLMLVDIAGAKSTDLGSPSRNPISLWERLDGLPQSVPNNAIADMAAAVRRLTPSDATVFLVMPQTKMAMLYFARRHQPGLLPTYEVGMFAGPYWLAENEARLRATPPDYLILARAEPLQAFRLPAPYIPDLLSEWQRDYRTIVYQNPYFLLLSRSF